MLTLGWVQYAYARNERQNNVTNLNVRRLWIRRRRLEL